jgi:hypothetical protein
VDRLVLIFETGSSKMNPKLIVMLTYNDVTVPDAIEVFHEIEDVPIEYFGFKDTGLPPEEMKKLKHALETAGKKTFLEVVRYSEEEILSSARLAVEYGFDYLMGTLYFDSVWNVIGKKVKYFPFCGEVYGHPSILDGAIDDITGDAVRLANKGVDGFDLLAYRYRDSGRVNDLIRGLQEAVKLPIVVAGSINSYERLNSIIHCGVWAFTIGSAFFEKKFVPGGSFRENVEAVCARLY